MSDTWTTTPIGVPAQCRTNIDDYKREEWPDVFVALPRVGDRVVAKSGRNLRIVEITHALDRTGRPFISVELHR